ncbi:MAG: hypothetical protein MZU95_03490 [Desulfomicrobium escambiense]|nr:hypothetical protein [Desulfomicrobium escambiense]
MELFSDINVFQPGYSELLLDKKYHGYAGLRDYSFAKYINGEIVLRAGEFPYDKSDAEPMLRRSRNTGFLNRKDISIFYTKTEIQHVSDQQAMMLTAKDTIISFAYLFVFLLLFINYIASDIPKA